MKTDTNNPTVKVEDSTKSKDTSKDTEKKDTTTNKDKSTETKDKKEDTTKEVEVTKGETSGNATTYTVKNTDKMTLSLSATGDSWIAFPMRMVVQSKTKHYQPKILLQKLI